MAQRVRGMAQDTWEKKKNPLILEKTTEGGRGGPVGGGRVGSG